MTENAIITAASLIGAGLVCLGAANGAGTGNGDLCGRTRIYGSSTGRIR